MTSKQRLVYEAAHLLALCASNRGETLRECAEAVGCEHPEAVQLARRALVVSLGAGNWREVRAAAESKLRAGEL